MFCKYCGKEIDLDVKFCSNCGKNIEDSQNSGFAIVSLIFGLISTVFYELVVFQILAIIFGYIALKKIKKKEATGKKRAIAGIILGILYFFHFGNKVCMKAGIYDQWLQQAYMEETSSFVSENDSGSIEKTDLIGTWSNSELAGEIIVNKILELKGDSFTVRNEIVSSKDGKIEGFSELYGTAQISNDIVVLYTTNASQSSTMPTDILIGKTEILKYKNNKLVYENGVELEKVK